MVSLMKTSFSAQRLAQWLKERGMFQFEFAKMLDVSPSTITRIVRGDYKPRIDLAIQIEQETEGFVPIRGWSDKSDYAVV